MSLPEAWRQVNAHVSVSLLETIVFANEMQIVTTDDDGPLHLHFTNDSGQDTATDRAHAGERTFLVDVVSRDCLKVNRKRFRFKIGRTLFNTFAECI